MAPSTSHAREIRSSSTRPYACCGAERRRTRPTHTVFRAKTPGHSSEPTRMSLSSWASSTIWRSRASARRRPSAVATLAVAEMRKRVAAAALVLLEHGSRHKKAAPAQVSCSWAALRRAQSARTLLIIAPAGQGLAEAHAPPRVAALRPCWYGARSAPRRGRTSGACPCDARLPKRDAPCARQRAVGPAIRTPRSRRPPKDRAGSP